MHENSLAIFKTLDLSSSSIFEAICIFLIRTIIGLWVFLVLFRPQILGLNTNIGSRGTNFHPRRYYIRMLPIFISEKRLGFNMKCFHKFFVVTLFLLMPMTNLHARTCAEKLSVTGRWLVAGAVASTIIIPLYGMGFITMSGAIYNKKTVERNIARLNAASLIAQYQTALHNDINRDVIKAYKIFDHFYENLEKKFPEMKLGKAEVVDWLDKINRMELGKRGCDALKNSSLGRAFFADAKIENWQKVLEEEIEANRDRVQAAQFRKEKNEHFLNQKISDEKVIEID